MCCLVIDVETIVANLLGSTRVEKPVESIDHDDICKYTDALLAELRKESNFAYIKVDKESLYHSLDPELYKIKHDSKDGRTVMDISLAKSSKPNIEYFNMKYPSHIKKLLSEQADKFLSQHV